MALPDQQDPRAEVAKRMLAMATDLTRLANDLLGGEQQRRRTLAVAAVEEREEEQGEEVTPPDRNVGTNGAVTFEVAKVRARELQEFTPGQFAYALGVEPATAMRWISELLHHKPPLLTRQGMTFRSTEKALLTTGVLDWIEKQDKPFSATAFGRDNQLATWEREEALRALQIRGTVRQVEVDGWTMYDPRPVAAPKIADVEVKRGAPVDHVGRGPDRLTRSRSKLQYKERQRRYNKQQAAKEERAKQQQERAKREASQPPRRKRNSRPVD